MAKRVVVKGTKDKSPSSALHRQDCLFLRCELVVGSCCASGEGGQCSVCLANDSGVVTASALLPLQLRLVFFFAFPSMRTPSVLFLHGGERDQVDGVSRLAKGY